MKNSLDDSLDDSLSLIINTINKKRVRHEWHDGSPWCRYCDMSQMEFIALRQGCRKRS